MPSAAWCSPNPNPLPVFYRPSKMSSFPFKCRIYPDSIALHKLLHKWNMSDYFYICVNIVCVHDLFFFNQNEMPRWMNEWMYACMSVVTSFPKHNFGFPPHKKTNPERFPLVATRGTQKKMFVLHGFTDLHGAQKPNVPGSAGSAVAKFPKRELQSCTVSLRNIQFRNHFLSALGSFTITRTHSALSGVLEFNSRGSVLEADSYF